MTPCTLDSAAVHATVRALPALPQALAELRLALQRDNVAVDELAATISRDQALTAKTLRLANSSFYGVRGRVASIRDAINVLGLRTVASVATTAMVVSSFNRTACVGFDFDIFWRHAIATAMCAQSLAKAARLDPEAAFSAGLLHDIGRLALATYFPRELAQALAWGSQQDSEPLAAERHMLGVDHALVGGLIAQHWHFSPDIVAAIREHHEVPMHASASLVDVVHVADNIAHALDLSASADEMVPPLSLPAWERLTIPAPQMLAILDATETQTRSVCESLTV